MLIWKVSSHCFESSVVMSLFSSCWAALRDGRKRQPATQQPHLLDRPTC